MTDEEKFRAAEQAAKQGDPEAQFQLGVMYHLGKGTEEDKDMTIYWYKKAADQGHPEAQYKYAYFLDISCNKIISWYEKAGKQGNISAQEKCGVIYYNGLVGVEQDQAKALYWYEKLGGQDLPAIPEHDRRAARLAQSDRSRIYQARYKCAKMYDKGEGTKQDLTKALYWYEKVDGAFGKYAKERAEEIRRREPLYREGMTAYKAKDYKRAFSLLEQAAELGHREAQYQCGRMYELGQGTELDSSNRSKTALYWYEKAAEQGHPKAQTSCAGMYSLGYGTAKDEDKARFWYKKAATQTEDMKERQWAENWLYLLSLPEKEQGKILSEVFESL